MASSIKRNKYLHTTKHQRKIIFLSLVPSLAICVLISIAMKVFHRDLIDLLLFNTIKESVQFINQWAVFILTALWTFLVMVTIWSYMVSTSLVGAFDRIIRELDEVIEGKDRKRLTARDGDELAKNLLKRINILINNLPQPRQPLKKD